MPGVLQQPHCSLPVPAGPASQDGRTVSDSVGLQPAELQFLEEPHRAHPLAGALAGSGRGAPADDLGLTAKQLQCALPAAASATGTDGSVAADHVGLQAHIYHLAQQLQRALPAAATLAGTHGSAAAHHVGLEIVGTKLPQELKSVLPMAVAPARTDGRVTTHHALPEATTPQRRPLAQAADRGAVADRVGLQGTRPNAMEQPERTLPTLALRTCTHNCRVATHIVGYPRMPGIPEKTQRPLPLVGPRQDIHGGAAGDAVWLEQL
eukprot:CAMPEP_0179028674 /NCGR_PEP_ID=MMETSP0796-20121207/9665_1 /TAXON_ID=73915 /ORGANISM="Pyrodinium bahamense, Strain pbaha01" /LENGTH=264 /DNA_ID=CAMNT_0020724819 /DNA_START=226 /DNA_END=1015 /DNA_ORIENTATION=+